MSNPVNNSEKKIAEHRLGTILVQAQGLAKLATILKKKNVATIKVSQLEEMAEAIIKIVKTNLN